MQYTDFFSAVKIKNVIRKILIFLIYMLKKCEKKLEPQRRSRRFKRVPTMYVLKLKQEDNVNPCKPQLTI